MTKTRSENLRDFFARYVVAQGRARNPRIKHAFATVAREDFAGPGPWSIAIPGLGYVQTPDDDPAFLYQDTLVAIDPARGLNIGHPSAHARWLDALALQPGETVIHAGTGTGYYTTLLAQLVGPAGRVHGYEIDEGLAARSAQNLAPLPWVTITAGSGLREDLPKTDAIYVNAGLSYPSWTWLDALRPGGRLLFPLQAPDVLGAMLLIRKPAYGLSWPATVVSPAGFIGCAAPENPQAVARLAAAFRAGGADAIRSFRIDEARDGTCWFAADDWWLSTAEPDLLT